MQWLERIRKAGINIPVVAGLLPVFSENTTAYASYLNGILIPAKLSKLIGLYGNNPDDFKKAGMEFTKNQICDFMNVGMESLHIFTVNKIDAIDEILNDVGFLRGNNFGT